MDQPKSLQCLAVKMIKIMETVGHIPKTGYNSFHKYYYTTEADIAAAFSKALQANKVFMFSNILERECKVYQTRAGKESFMVTVKLEVTFVDADSDEKFSAIFYGDGADSDDKGI